MIRFAILDEQAMPPADWQRARELARWIRPDGKRIQLGDGLIRAIAERFHCEFVDSRDKSFPRGIRKKKTPAALTFPRYRFENWKLLRAPLRPYFLRSFMRLSRVR